MNIFPRWLIIALVLAFVLLLAGSTRFYYVQMRSLRQGAENDLQTIAQAKVDQIVTWRTERLADASVLMDSPFFVEAVARWMADPRPEVAEEIIALFRSQQVYYHYSDILLVDSGSQVRLILSGRSAPLDKNAAQALSAAFRERRPVFTDLHEGADDQAPHIGTVVPLFTRSGQGPGMVGAVILECEARQYLYPLIQSWPIPSRSAETLLVRRDGDAVLFLNELRHQKGTALKLRIPLTQKEVPAVMAVLGREGVVEGKDYRGIEVLSVLKAIPDSPWFMVAKVDKAEALSVLRSESVLILVVILGFAVAAISAVGMVWQRNAKAYYRSLFQMEAARRESEERYRTTLMSVGDGVISTDAEGRVKFLNPAAEHLTGWSEIEAHGKSLEEVFRIINEETRAEVENPVERVLREGLVVGLANHTVLIARDGTEHPIADSGSPILDERGVITGVVLVFRDQTVERAAQKALRQSEERYRKMVEAVTSYTFSVEMKEGLAVSTRHSLGCQALTGFSPEEYDSDPYLWFSMIHPEDRENVRLHLDGVLSGEGLPALEHRIIHRDGSVRWVRNTIVFFRNHSGKLIRYDGLVENITERKQAEEALKESENKYRELYDEAPVGYHEIDREGRLTRVNKTEAELLGYALEEMIGRYVWEFIVPDQRGISRKSIKTKIEQKKTGESFERKYICKNGKEIDVYITDRLILDKSGNLLGIRSTLENITERKRAEEALKESENKYRELYDEAPVGYHEIDREGRLTRVNKTEAELLGYALEEMIGRYVWEFIVPDQRGISRKSIKTKIEQKKTGEGFERKYICKNGKEIDVYITDRLILDKSGNLIGIRSTLENITERKQVEEKIQASLQEKELMLQEIYHRVKNNLQVISSLLDLKSRNVRGKKAAEIFKECKTFVRAMSLVHEKFYQSRDLARINFKEYIESITKELVRAYYHAEKKIALKFDLEDISLEIGSAISCGLVLNELVTNSLKHAFPEGKHGELNVSLHAGEKNDIVLTVGDSGIGLPHGFNFRSSKSFGLNLVTGLVERQLMGKIELTESHGTEFRVTFQGIKPEIN